MDPFTEWLESISEYEMEPFCPFSIMYIESNFLMNKLDVKPGDVIHIYHMSCEFSYRDREGVVKYND